MKKSSNNNLRQSTSIAQSTIDTILTQGATRLYDRYIQTKIPKNVRNSFEKIIENVFNPAIDNQGTDRNKVNLIHQSFRQKISVIEQKKKSLSNLDPDGKSFIRGLAKTIEVSQIRSSKNGFKEKVKQKCHERTRQLKEQSKCMPNPSDNFDQFDNDDQLQQKWTERQQRFNLKLQHDQHVRQTNQKSARLKKQLENQLRQLQENNKTITFNHHTGRLFHLDEHHQYSKEDGKLRFVNIQFGLTDEKNISSEKQVGVKESLIRNSRKITSFQRNRRKINFIDQQADDSNYNNNGERQISNIPYIDIQEGVNFFEGKNMNTIDIQNKNKRTRINSASLTHRTFKSYTRQKMESSRFCRTIATATSATKTRYMNRGETDEKKLQNGVKSSILWSKRGEIKNHKITKNTQLVGNYFDWTEQ